MSATQFFLNLSFNNFRGKRFIITSFQWPSQANKANKIVTFADIGIDGGNETSIEQIVEAMPDQTCLIEYPGAYAMLPDGVYPPGPGTIIIQKGGSGRVNLFYSRAGGNEYYAGNYYFSEKNPVGFLGWKRLVTNEPAKIYDLQLQEKVSSYTDFRSSYFKDNLGLVHVTICALSDENIIGSEPVAVLPEGFRPAHRLACCAFACRTLGLQDATALPMYVYKDGRIILAAQSLYSFIAAEVTFPSE